MYERGFLKCIFNLFSDGSRDLLNYRIRSFTTMGFYFSILFFGWGSIQKIPQKVDFLTKKWGSIQEKLQKLEFWKEVRVYSRVRLYTNGYCRYLIHVSASLKSRSQMNIVFWNWISVLSITKLCLYSTFLCMGWCFVNINLKFNYPLFDFGPLGIWIWITIHILKTLKPVY